MKNSEKATLLFDLDGTLIDSIELILSSMEFALKDRDRMPTRSQWTAGIGTPLREQLAPWCNSDADLEAVIQRYRQYQDMHLETLTSVYPQVLEVVRWARGMRHPLALVTSKGRYMTERSLVHTGLDNIFDIIVTVEDTARHKPEPEPVWFALEKLGAAAENSLFVGDSPHDMHAGRAAGVLTAAATWGPFSREELAVASPDFWLTSPDDLKSILASGALEAR